MQVKTRDAKQNVDIVWDVTFNEKSVKQYIDVNAMMKRGCVHSGDVSDIIASINAATLDSVEFSQPYNDYTPLVVRGKELPKMAYKHYCNCGEKRYITSCNRYEGGTTDCQRDEIAKRHAAQLDALLTPELLETLCSEVKAEMFRRTKEYIRRYEEELVRLAAAIEPLDVVPPCPAEIEAK